jgi:hypothetical protein
LELADPAFINIDSDTFSNFGALLSLGLIDEELMGVGELETVVVCLSDEQADITSDREIVAANTNFDFFKLTLLETIW